MSKGLEALNRIGKVYYPTESKNLYFSEDYGDDFDIIEKELKVLEIVKKKSEFSFWDFKHCDNFDEYNELYNTRDNRLTQEEFNFLKEVFEYE